ncbi:RES family NAD+ phosphorylase [Humidisolicoccus flavus]|uniref:RES family NAD+ phosphorylase n=1 Tax=Humidisolicoccus flavus TaxID=3111414 RepID=UPI00324DE788
MSHSIFAPPIRGTFYRAIDPRFREHAIRGSRAAGRYSRADQPTLYLSSSIEGVEAAMIAHSQSRASSLEIVELTVEAQNIVDLRDPEALKLLGVDLVDATAPWQELAAAGRAPASWSVRDRLTAAGANGLIDPSRQSPGLWHLVLFRWNTPGAPAVAISGNPRPKRG